MAKDYLRVRETIRVTALPGIGSFTGVLWLMEQYAAQTAWWSVIPFGCITLMVFSFWIGHDVYYSNAPFRIWYRRLRSFGEFQNVITKREYSSLGNDHGGKQEFIAIYAHFVFSKARVLDTVMIRGAITGYIANRLTVVDRITMQKSSNYSWRDTSFIGTRYISEDRIEIPIAFIPTKSGNPGVYGDKSLNGCYFSEGKAHFIEVKLFTGKQRQTHTVQIFMPLTADCTHSWYK
jgi:hypothetical protein